MCSIESPLSSSGLQSMSNVFLPVWKDCYVGQRSTFFSRLIVMGSTLHCTHEQRSLQISLSLTLILGLQACHCNSLPIRHEACIQHHHDVGWKIQHFPAPVMPRLQQKHTSLNQICRAMPQHLSCASSPHIQRKHNKNTQGKHTKKHAMILVDAHRAKDKGELTTWFFFFVRVLVFVLVEFEFMLEIQTGLHQLHFFFFCRVSSCSAIKPFDFRKSTVQRKLPELPKNVNRNPATRKKYATSYVIYFDKFGFTFERWGFT